MNNIYSISDYGFTGIISFEIGSYNDYVKLYQSPTYPGASSGVTIGFGFDLGYYSKDEIHAAWAPYIRQEWVSELQTASGYTGLRAKAQIGPKMRAIIIPYQAAMSVYVKYTLPRYAKLTIDRYPNSVNLHPGAAAAMLSTVYNRGNSTYDDPTDGNHRRREMKALQPLVAAADYEGMAKQFESMRRLWDGVPNYYGASEARLSGLVKRYTTHAQWCRQSENEMLPESRIIKITLN